MLPYGARRILPRCLPSLLATWLTSYANMAIGGAGEPPVRVPVARSLTHPGRRTSPQYTAI